VRRDPPFGQNIKRADGATPLPVTTADLQAIFTAGPPSLRSIATASAQSTVDTYFTQFGDSATKTWKPEDVDGDAEAGVASGGKYANASIVNAFGLDLRAATSSVLLNGSLYNYALALSTGAITSATIDRLLALYGATPALLDAAGGDAGDAGADVDQLMAAFASNRDSKINAPGPYRKIRSALLIAKAAATAGADKCRTDLDAALSIYFSEWEKTSSLTVIYYLNLAGAKAVALPQEGSAALQAYGAAVGFAQSFKGIPQDRRKITDVQIDGVLATIGATTPYQLITRSGDRVTAFNTAVQQIGAIYSLTATEIEEAKKAY
jgi:hypothetical protein